MARDARDKARRIVERLNDPAETVARPVVEDALREIVKFLDAPHDIVVTLDTSSGTMVGRFL